MREDYPEVITKCAFCGMALPEGAEVAVIDGNIVIYPDNECITGTMQQLGLLKYTVLPAMRKAGV